MVNVRLKTAMFESGISGLHLAQKIGMGPTRLSYIMNGWTTPTEEEKVSIETELKHTDLFVGASEIKQKILSKKEKKNGSYSTKS